MNKFFPLVLGLLFPLAGAFAQDMDKSNADIIQACSKAKDGIEGTYINFKEGACEYSGCAYAYSATDIDYDGTNERMAGSCAGMTKAGMRAKAKKAADAEIDRKIKELEAKKKKIAAIGNGSGGANSVELPDLNGDGVIDDKDRAIYDRMMREARDGDAYDEAGRRISDSSGTVRIEECEFDLTIDHPCYKKCLRKDGFLGIFGKRTVLKLNRKACLKCLSGYGIFPKGADGKLIGSASIKIKCTTGMQVDANGRCISIGGGRGGSAGSVGSGGGGVGGIGGSGGVVIGGGNGNVNVGNGNGNGGLSIGASGSMDVPAFCYSKKKKDKNACEAWIRANSRFACSSSADVSRCLGGDYNEIMARYSSDGCVNCQAKSGNKQHWTTGVAEIFGALAPVGVAAFGAHAQIKSSQAWAGAAAVGFEQCQISQNNYLGYLSSNELPGMTPTQQAGMNCNGYQLGGFGGLGGQYGSYYGGGYTPGYVGGSLGSYGGYNPYGYGGMAGGAVGGVYTGGYSGGMAGGMAGGMVGGMVGGMYAGGYNGGMAGGMYAGGYNGGMAGGMYAGGYNGGMTGGLVNGISLAGGIAGGGGYNGGFNGGMYAGGMAGGMAGGGMYAGGIAGGGGMYAGGIAGGGGMYAGGMAGGGGMYAGGMAGGGGMYAGGMAGGGYNGGFGMGGGMGGMYGGYGSGVGQGNNGYYGNNSNYYGATMGNPQADYAASMQASNYDKMLQQQGTSYQMGMMGSGYGGGGAAYSPMNAGYSLGVNYGYTGY